MEPGKKLKLRTEKRNIGARKGKPWYYDMALYEPSYHYNKLNDKYLYDFEGSKENTDRINNSLQNRTVYRQKDGSYIFTDKSNEYLGEPVQTHGFYRPEDEGTMPFAGEEHVPDLIKRLGGDVRDTPEYQKLQEALIGPSYVDNVINRRDMFDTGKLKVINESAEGRSRWRHDRGGSPFTPEFVDILQKLKADSEIQKAKRDRKPALVADDTDARKNVYNKNRKAFMKFVEDLSARAYMERNAK